MSISKKSVQNNLIQQLQRGVQILEQSLLSSEEITNYAPKIVFITSVSKIHSLPCHTLPRVRHLQLQPSRYSITAITNNNKLHPREVGKRKGNAK